MCCDCYKEFFGVGLDPLPATYKLKQSVFELICMNLTHMIVIVSNHDTFETNFITINLLFATIGTVFHFILLKGAHQKDITTIYNCISTDKHHLLFLHGILHVLLFSPDLV